MATTMFTMGEQTITVNGVTMSLKAYKKQKRAEAFEKLSKAKKAAIKREKKARKNHKTEIQTIPQEIKSLLKQVKVMKSLEAYYTNGYRQWGNIAKGIINDANINKPFKSFVETFGKIDKHVEEINEIAKHNERAIFAYLRKLSYLMDDAKTQMNALQREVGLSGYINRNLLHECISGEGRRLGLRTLMSRTLKAIGEIEYIRKRLEHLADEGVGAEYSEHSQRIINTMGREY